MKTNTKPVSQIVIGAMLNPKISVTAQRLLRDKDFVYTPSTDSDIRKTWAKFGWTPKGAV